MSDLSAAPLPPARRWRVLFTPRWLSWHLFAVVAFVGMLWLGDWQFMRAIGGNALSWAYTFEWPVFAVFGAVFWVKTVKDELHPPDVDLTGYADDELSGEAEPGPDAAAPGSLVERQLALARAGGRRAGGPDDELTETEATELAEYNAYLARLDSRQAKS